MKKRSAAMTALLVLATVPVAVEAAPRSKASASAVKKAVAAKKAAANEAARREAEQAAQRAAAEAERARIRAQWGLLAELLDQNFEGDGYPITVRQEDGGNTVALTMWYSTARATYRVKRDPASGALTYDFPGQWSRQQHAARIGDQGVVEAETKHDVSWPLLKRDPSGAFVFAQAAGRKTVLIALDPTGKAASKLARLIADGKVSAAGVSAGASPGSSASNSMSAPIVPAGIPSMATLQAAEGLKFFRNLEGDWWNGTVKWSFVPTAQGVNLEGSAAGSVASKRTIELKHDKLLVDRGPAVPIAGGVFLAKRDYAVLRNPDDSFSVTAGKLKDGRFIPSNRSDLAYLGTYRRMTPDMADQMRQQVEQYRVAQAELAARKAEAKRAKGNSGWLGGLAAGFGAAMAGGDAGMIMGAAMKGVELTTDNEMTRNVMAGQGDAMIQSSIDLQNQKAELERLRVAAQDETRRKQEAAEREAANARAADNARRVADANARQQAITNDYTARQATTRAAKADQVARDEAARARRLADQKQRDADAAAASRSANATSQLASSVRPSTTPSAGPPKSSASGCGWVGKPGPTPTACDPGPRVPIYGHFTGISLTSRADAEADAMAACAKAGKSCHVVEVLGGNGRHWRVEVAYATGEYRRVTTGASKVSGQ